jgi:4-amino-4-deoxy-L-arabinose transferase-like glycosyltransferase
MNKIKEEFVGLMLAVIAFVLNIPFIPKIKVVLWDAAVYLMNAKWFAGSQVFFEILRAPLWPLILSIFYRIGINNQAFFFVFSAIISAISVYLTYKLATELFGVKTGIASAIALVVIPLHFYWSPLIYTEIPSSVLVLLSILAMWKGLKDERFQYVSILLASLAFLTRYPTAPLIPALFLFLFLQKRLDIKKFLMMSAIAALPVALWLGYNQLNFGSALQTFAEGLEWGSIPEPWYYYFTALPTAVNAILLVTVPGIIFAFRNTKEKRMQLLLIPLISFFVVSCVLAHKEPRYLLPFMPVFLIASLSFMEKLRWKHILLILVPLAAIALGFSLKATVTFVEDNSCAGIIAASQDISGETLSTYWPQTSYYGNVNATPFPPKEQQFDSWMIERNISFVVTSSKGGWPDYAKNSSFFENKPYLAAYKTVNDSCQSFRVYKVIKA